MCSIRKTLMEKLGSGSPQPTGSQPGNSPLNPPVGMNDRARSLLSRTAWGRLMLNFDRNRGSLLMNPTVRNNAGVTAPNNVDGRF